LECLRHPCKFQRVSHLGSVTAWHSSGGRQPNFVALNRGCHLYSAGRPSRWALAHISSWLYINAVVVTQCILSSEQRTFIRHNATGAYFGFWATICKTICPMLSDCPVCLSVCDVGVLWLNGWMDQYQTWHGGRPWPRPHCVGWG